MKFTNITKAQNFRNRCDKIMMIVLMEEYLLVVTPAVASKYEKQGYQTI